MFKEVTAVGYRNAAAKHTELNLLPSLEAESISCSSRQKSVNKNRLFGAKNDFVFILMLNKGESVTLFYKQYLIHR